MLTRIVSDQMLSLQRVVVVLRSISPTCGRGLEKYLSEHFSALSRISSLRGGARSALNRLSVSGRVNRNLGKSFFALFFFSIFELLCRGASQQTSENPNHTVSHFFVPRFFV